MLGYIDNPSENEKVVKKHSDGKIWIHTGDLGYISEKGSVFITGRIKRAYITQVNGTVSKIFPDRIEQIISQNEEISNCCVVCTGNAESTYYPVAYVVLKQEYLTSEEEVRKKLIKKCKNELPAYAQPHDYFFKSALPLTSVGKIDYRKLEETAKVQTELQ